MRHTWSGLLSVFLLSVIVGCAGTPVAPSAPQPAALPDQVLGSPLLQGDTVLAPLGAYALTVGADGASAAIEPLRSRTAAQNDDVYDLSVAAFLGAEDLTVRRIARGTGTVDVTLRFAHPFAGPTDPAGTPTSTNRVDLGLAARVLVLLDADPLANRFFEAPNSIVARPDLLTNADGFFKPGGLVVPPAGMNANTFPYLAVVDEALDNRIGQSNGGQVTGNYDPVDGWIRATLGPAGEGWTGYGVLHQGQAAVFTLQFDAAQLAAITQAPVILVPIGNYNDPRGGSTSQQKRANRLPAAIPDYTQFAYRMPHGALDGEAVRFLAESGGLGANTLSASTCHFYLTDWDARAEETGDPDLAEESILSRVAQGEAGVATVEVVVPSLSIAATALTLVDDDTAFGGDVAEDTGAPDDRLYFTGDLTNTTFSGQTAGIHWGMLRAIDPEAQNTLNDDWRIALDPDLRPLQSDIPEPITYQAFPLVVGTGNFPPVPTMVTTPPLVGHGQGTSITIGGLSDVEHDPIDVSVDWQDNGTFTPAGTLLWGGTQYPVPVQYDSDPITFTFTGTAADDRTLHVKFSDPFNEVIVDLDFTVVFCMPDSFTTTAAWTPPASWPYYTVAASADHPMADMAPLRIAADAGGVIYGGYDSGKWDLFRSILAVTGPGTNVPVSNFSGPSTKSVAQVEIDSTNRIFFALRGAGDPYFGPPSALYPPGTGVEANIHWFDYTAGTPATSYSTINTSGDRVLAMTIDAQDNLYYIDTNHVLHKLLRASTPTPYLEDTAAGLPWDLKSATYGGGITSTGATAADRKKIHDFIMDWRSGAFFILAQSEETNTPTVKNGYLYKIDCDGSFSPTVDGNPNPATYWLTDSSTQHRKADIAIDQLAADGSPLPGEAASSQIIVSGYCQSVVGAPELVFMDVNLAEVGSLDVEHWGSTPLAINTDNDITSGFSLYFVGYTAYTDVIGQRVIPIPGWQ